MDSEETILQQIQKMGYHTVTPRKIEPSYYKIDNGTILRVYTLINALHPKIKNTQTPDYTNQWDLNSVDIVTTFTPQSQRGAPSNVVLTQKQMIEGIIDEDVSIETLRENFSVYDVSDGTTLSIKSIVGQVSKTKYFNYEGEPIYMISTNIVPKLIKPKNKN